MGQMDFCTGGWIVRWMAARTGQRYGQGALCRRQLYSELLQPGLSIPTAHRAPVAAFTAAPAGPPLSPAGKSSGLTRELSKVRPFFDSW